MGLPRSVVEQHIREWSQRLAPTSWPYRQFWPHRLFRHEPLENAAQVLRTGQLLSRRDVAQRGLRHIDIAAPEVIATRGDAHGLVRLYFRPRNPTQYRIEGVRRTEECIDHDPQRQAAVLVVLTLDARAVLTRDDVRFSNGNMQASAERSQIGGNEEFFRSINFEQVYHEGPFDPNSGLGWDIKRARNAEVLVASPLPVHDIVKAVVCRSAAERATLLHSLGDQTSRWSDRVIVEPMPPGIFFREKAFVEAVEADSAGFTVSFHPRKDNRTVPVRVEVKEARGRTVLQSGPRELDLSSRWRWACPFPPGIYIVSIELEGQLAHRAPVLLDDAPF